MPADLADDDVAHEVGVQHDAERLAADGRERMVDGELSARTRPRTGPGRLPTLCSRHTLRHEPQAAAGGARLGDALGRHVAQALLLDVGRRDAGVHGDVGQRGALAGGVPAVDVVRRIGLGDALGLRLRQGILEAAARAHRVEDEVGGAVEDGLEAEQAAVAAGRTRAG